MKKRIILYVLILIIIAICNYLVIKLIFISNKKFDNCKVEIGEIKANYGKKIINITSVDTNIDIGDEKKYARIGIKIEDANGTDALMDSYLFEIADENKEVISMCQTAAINDDEKMINILPSYLKANETINGYLYCETNRKDINWLKISYVYEAKYDQDGEVNLDSKILYIKL